MFCGAGADHAGRFPPRWRVLWGDKPMSKHTEGPWYSAKTGNHQGLVISEATSENVAVTYNGDEDAVLIAAAPELLEACKEWLSDEYADNEDGYRDRARAMGRAAIAKAEGRG